MKKIEPLVSVVVPMYKAEDHLSRCVTSIINQTYRNLEIVLVDDGSPDACLSMAKKYRSGDKRVVVRHKDNGGVSSARNLGISIATGQFITFVDADDWIEPTAIATMVGVLKDMGVDCVRSSYYINSDSSEQMITTKMVSGLHGRQSFSELIRDFVTDKVECYCFLLMIRRDIISGNISFDETLQLMEDKNFYCGLLAHIDSLYFINLPTYHYYLNPSGATKSLDVGPRNTYRVINAHNAIVATLENGKYLTDSIFKDACTSHTLMVSGMLFAKSKDTSREDTKKLLRNLSKDPEYSRMVAGSRLFGLPIKKSISVFLARLSLVSYRASYILYAFSALVVRMSRNLTGGDN